MSVFEQIERDLAGLIAERAGLFELTNVNGRIIPACIHDADSAVRSSVISNIEWSCDKICLVREADLVERPEVGAVFYLSESEYRVSSLSVLGGKILRIALSRPSY